MAGTDRHDAEVEYIEDSSATRRAGRPIRYIKGKFLGKGGFAKCYEAIDCESKAKYAIKIVNKASVQKPRAYAKLKSEIAIHRNLAHERVVKMYTYFEDTENVYILLELCPCSTLNDLLRKKRRFSEPEALYYMYDLIMGVKYLHRHRVLHRDLKLGNLFLDEQMKLKIGDFGLAAQLEHEGEKKKTICGTPNYIAPEILDGKTGHSYEVDVWSIGVILYTCLFGRPPFETNDVKQTYRKIRHSQYTFPEHPAVSQAAKQLITSILRVEPKARPSLDQILETPWMRSTQLPPALPTALLSGTPRPASARSDTPERGTIEFARIDSPVNSMNRVLASGSDRPCSPRTPLLRPGEATPKKVDSAAVRRSERPGPPLPSSARSARPPIRGPVNDENAAPPGTYVQENTPREVAMERPLLERQALSGNTIATPKADLKHGPASTQALLNHRPQSASTAVGSGSTRTSPLGSTSTDRNGRQPTPPATRRQPSCEGPVSARTPKPSASPRTTALRLTPRNGPLVTGSTTALTGRTSPLRGSTPIAREARTPTGPATSSQGLLSPAQLVDALGGVSSPRGSTRRSLSARALGALPTQDVRETWVVQWMDYTCKYGVGYFLSDGSCGVYFNDSTKIVQPSGAATQPGGKFEYITRRVNDQPEQKSVHTWTDYPQELHKKATLLKHFNHYMYNDEQKEGVTSGRSSMQGTSDSGGTQLYVKKWMRSRHAILFQLSNKLVQVHFLVDETELLFSSRYQVVTYVDKKREKHTYPLQTILDVPNPELSKRLRYAKDMLINLVGGSEKPKPRA
jgi:serine/threonine protein kinase